MNELILEHKDEFNSQCYFFGILSPKKGKLRFWNDKTGLMNYYDYIGKTGYQTIEDWISDMGYKPEEVYFGSTKYTVEKNLRLLDFIEKYYKIYDFPEEEELLHEDEEMKDLSSNFGGWCFCCKRTCSTCSKKNM